MRDNTVQPFVWVSGRPYLVINWELDAPPTHEEILILRPLSPTEAELLQQMRSETIVEAWASVVAFEKGRFQSVLEGEDTDG